MNKQIEEILNNKYYTDYAKRVHISNLLDQEMVKFAEWVYEVIKRNGWEYMYLVTPQELKDLYKAEMNNVDK